MADNLSIGEYLIKRVYDLGIRHVFGIPGDYVIGFFGMMEKSHLNIVNTCDEQSAGFAADAYARMKGLGVVCVTYGVGGLKLANTTAQAFAEKSPVLVISGAPGQQERLKNPMLHHKVNLFNDQFKVFERLTVASSELSDPERAFFEIDRVLDAILQNKRPGYLELPRDMISIVPKNQSLPMASSSPLAADPDTLTEAVEEATMMINQAEKPVILAGMGVERYGLADQVLGMASRGNIPLTASIMGKSAIPEEESLYMGVYAGILGNEGVRDYVESSDCIIMVGAYLSDLDIGALTAPIDQNKVIHITADRVTLRHHIYPGLGFNLLIALTKAGLRRHEPGDMPCCWRQNPSATAVPDAKITAERVFQYVSSFLDEKNILIPDVGDALFGSAEISLACPFISPAYYASMGFSVPASIGAQLACPELRPVVIVGDGAFQMTGMEVSTAVKYGLNPIVIVLNNQGYGTLRLVNDGCFNDLFPWKYSRVPEVIGTGMGKVVRTEMEMEEALDCARNYNGLCILEVILEKNSVSLPLQRLGMALKKRL